MKVLVTGGSGFLGPNICDILVNDGFEVTSFDVRHPAGAGRRDGALKRVEGDVTSLDSILACLREDPADMIVAAAAKILGDQEDPLGTFRVNVLGVANVLEAARRTGAKRVVFTSTAGVYGRTDAHKLLGEDLPLTPEDTYEHTKAVAEGWVETYRSRYSLDVIVVRFPFLYGPKGYLVWPLNVVLYHGIKGLPLRLKQGGDYQLEYLHVRDAAAGVVDALRTNDPEHHMFNIGTGRCVKVFEVAEAVRKLFPSFNCEIGPGLWSSEMLNSWVRGPLDISRARDELGYRPRFDVEKGIADLAAWEQAHPEELATWPKSDLWLL